MIIGAATEVPRTSGHPPGQSSSLLPPLRQSSLPYSFLPRRPRGRVLPHGQIRGVRRQEALMPSPHLRETLPFTQADLDRTAVPRPQVGSAGKAMSISALGRGCGIALTYPAPLEGDYNDAERESRDRGARRSLGRTRLRALQERRVGAGSGRDNLPRADERPVGVAPLTPCVRDRQDAACPTAGRLPGRPRQPVAEVRYT